MGVATEPTAPHPTAPQAPAAPAVPGVFDRVVGHEQRAEPDLPVQHQARRARRGRRRTFGPGDIEAAGALFERPHIAAADLRAGRDADIAGHEHDELTHPQPHVQPRGARGERDVAQIHFQAAGAELVAVAHFAEALRAVDAFARAPVQVDVGGGDHRHRHRKRDGRQCQPARPACERAEHEQRAERHHRPGCERPVDTAEPPARGRRAGPPTRRRRSPARASATGAGRRSPASPHARATTSKPASRHSPTTASQRGRRSNRHETPWRSGMPTACSAIPAATSTTAAPSTIRHAERSRRIGAPAAPSSGTSSRSAR